MVLQPKASFLQGSRTFPIPLPQAQKHNYPHLPLDADNYWPFGSPQPALQDPGTSMTSILLFSISSSVALSKWASVMSTST